MLPTLGRFSPANGVFLLLCYQRKQQSLWVNKGHFEPYPIVGPRHIVYFDIVTGVPLLSQRWI